MGGYPDLRRSYYKGKFLAKHGQLSCGQFQRSPPNQWHQLEKERDIETVTASKSSKAWMAIKAGFVAQGFNKARYILDSIAFSIPGLDWQITSGRHDRRSIRCNQLQSPSMYQESRSRRIRDRFLSFKHITGPYEHLHGLHRRSIRGQSRQFYLKRSELSAWPIN